MSYTYPAGVQLHSTTSTAVSDPGVTIRCRGRAKLFRFLVGDTATIVVQGSAGYDDWHTLTTETGTTMYQNTDPWPYMRVNVTASSSEYGAYMVMGA